MSWLDRLRREDRTLGWVRDPMLRLNVDFTAGALCGKALGEPLESVSFLGPTGRKTGADGDLEYPALGLSVGVSGDAIDAFIVYWQDPLGKRFQPFAGSVLHQGRVVPLGPTTAEAELLAAFGSPYFRDQDEGETILFYELRDGRGRLTERQVELDANGTLQSMILCADPILADAGQREAFGVDRPWPPG